LILVPGAAQARHRRTADFSTAIARSAAYEVAIKDAAARYSVDPRLLWTVAYLESRLRPRLVSRKGARGMMQFMPATGRRYGLLTIRDLHDPARSIEAAAMYLRDLSAMFGGRIDLILAGYNPGENAVIASGYRVPRCHETLSYVARGRSVFGSLVQVVQTSSTISHRAARTTQIDHGISNSHSGPHPFVPRTQPARSIYFAF